MEPHIQRLNKDLIKAAATMSDDEARFLVDAYYIIQEDRKRSGNQIRAMKDEPHETLGWFFDTNKVIEASLKGALDKYSDSKDIGRWMKSIYGVGPVIAAGVMARLDIRKAPTAGHFWSYSGLNPEKKWLPKTKRPWDPSAKTLAWHIGQSFMKFSKREGCYYGPYYRKRKEFEETRNANGYNKDLAAELLPKFDPKTESYGYLKTGVLPPAHVDARARRWVSKIFLSHVHHVWYEMEFKTLPPKPFAIEHLGHAHFIPIPNYPFVEDTEDKSQGT